jgi:hypothetical protein
LIRLGILDALLKQSDRLSRSAVISRQGGTQFDDLTSDACALGIGAPI